MTAHKKFFDQFVAAAEMAESDLDEICYASFDANKTLRETVTIAFKLGVAEGLASAECIVARSLKIKVDEMENSDNPALRALMKLSIECYQATNDLEGMTPGRASREEIFLPSKMIPRYIPAKTSTPGKRRVN